MEPIGSFEAKRSSKLVGSFGAFESLEPIGSFEVNQSSDLVGLFLQKSNLSLDLVTQNSLLILILILGFKIHHVLRFGLQPFRVSTKTIRLQA